jgi:transcriptional regulator with XRE-family HTH domain
MARESAGLTQAQLAVRAGLRQSALSKIESGALEPSFARLRALVALTGYELDVGIRRRQLSIDEGLLFESWRSLPEERVENTVRLSRNLGEAGGAGERARADRLERALDEIADPARS